MNTVANREVKPGRNYRVSAKEVVDLTVDFQLINGFITVKEQEKAVKEIIEINKPHFIQACDNIADGQNQISFKREDRDVILYTIERKKYDYSKSIVALEKELKEAKAKFESKNDPTEVTRCWAVKL